MTTPALPAGYRGRPAAAADVPALQHLVAACELAAFGRAETDEGGIAADLARPGLDPALDTVVVHAADGRLAARAWVDRRSEVDVHPDHRGRGLGAALLDWVDARAAEAGTGAVVQVVPDSDAAAAALVRSRGYGPYATSWLLGIDLPAEPAVPVPPDGVTVRAFEPGDAHAVHELTEDAFDEWQQRRKPFEEWAAHTVGRKTFAPDASPLAFDGGEVVGAVLSLDLPEYGEGYVESVAVRRDQRNRGLARLLLRTAFGAAYRRGRRGCALWTHSQTGALSLYERVGMAVRRSSTVYRRPPAG